MQKKRWVKGIIFSFFLLGLDILSKYLTVLYVSPIRWFNFAYPYGGIGVFKDFFGISFSINYVANTGAAWGIFAQHKWLLLVFRICIVFGLLFYLCKTKKKVVPIMLILTGAVGNILDFFFYGHVVDMFHFNFWGWSFPVFNLADAMISLGIVLWFFMLCFKKRKSHGY